MLIFDCETNGLLPELTKIHCLHTGDPDTGEQWRYSDTKVSAVWHGTVEDGLRLLQDHPVIGGHNVFRFDLRALKKVYPWFNPVGYIWDTMALAALVWPKDSLQESDGKLQRKGKLPPEFFKAGHFATHKLGAWGYRLGHLKGEFSPANYTNPATGEPHTWATIPFTADMDDYCAQDVAVNMSLWNRICEKLVSARAAYLENEVLRIIADQEAAGFFFDKEKAEALTQELMLRREYLAGQLRTAFNPWWARKGGIKQSTGLCKRTRRVTTDFGGHKVKATYLEGAEYTKIDLRMFNPSSRADIADRLTRLYGWEPTVFTDSGQPEISEETLDGMHFPEAAMLKEYLMVGKRLGQLAEGKQALLVHLTEQGTIHGRVNTNQAVTGRMTHSFPNVAQVPRVGTAYGKEFRSLFKARKGRLLVGCDAEGLELRCLGHFMAKHDGGSYGNTVVNGKKEDKTDVHSVNQGVMKLDSRDGAKTCIYALIYGGGDAKLGIIKVDDMPDERRRDWLAKRPTNNDRQNSYRKLGTALRRNVMEGLPALAKLTEGVKGAASRKGYLVGIDGRHLRVRKAHAALNVVLQSAGALVMKLALVLAEAEFRRRGWMQDGSVIFVANVHDEFQMDVDPAVAGEVMEISKASITQAGEFFGFRTPLAGSADCGETWADTH